MKLFVFFLFAALPWLPWVGDWALRWTEGNEKVQIAFAMFIFPLAMNAVQYWIIDSIIMEKQGQRKAQEGGYERVQGGDGDGGEHDDDEDGDGETVIEEDVRGKDSEDGVAGLKEAEPTPMADWEGSGSTSRSRGASPRGVDAGKKVD